MILDYPDGPQIQFTSVLMKEEKTQTLREGRKPREDGNSAANYSVSSRRKPDLQKLEKTGNRFCSRIFRGTGALLSL